MSWAWQAGVTLILLLVTGCPAPGNGNPAVPGVMPATVATASPSEPVVSSPQSVPGAPTPSAPPTAPTPIPPTMDGIGGGGAGTGAVADMPVPVDQVVNPMVNATPVTSLPPTAEPPAPAAFAPGSKLVFVGTVAGNADLYTANADGSGPVRLTSDRYSDLYPSMSADCREIVWCSDRGGGIFALYRAWADGSHVVRLTFGTMPAVQPAFSPDGQKIAFVRWTGLATSVVSVINRDGSGEVAVSPDGGQAFGPTWSPDGSRLLFGSNHATPGIPVLYTMPAAGGTLQAVTQTNGADYPNGRAVWSPDGSRIAYAANVANHGLGITLIAPDGSNRTELTHGGDVDPVWRADGSQILFTSGANQVAVMQADGTGLHVLPLGMATAAQPWW